MRHNIEEGDTVVTIAGLSGEMKVIQSAPSFVICKGEDGELMTFNPWELKIVRMRGQE